MDSSHGAATCQPCLTSASASLQVSKQLEFRDLAHFSIKTNKATLLNTIRPADDDRGPGGLWEILPAAGNAGRDADHRGQSLLEQVRPSAPLKLKSLR